MAHRVRQLANCPTCFKPTKKYGGVKWRKPQFSAMQIAKLRKTTILAGEEWAFEPPIRELRPIRLKGTKHARAKEDRLEAIRVAMLDMPEKIEQNRLVLTLFFSLLSIFFASFYFQISDLNSFTNI